VGRSSDRPTFLFCRRALRSLSRTATGERGSISEGDRQRDPTGQVIRGVRYIPLLCVHEFRTVTRHGRRIQSVEARDTSACPACAGPQRLYTAAEAGEFLGGIAASWLEKKAAHGLIPATYVGKYLRFSSQGIREIQQMDVRRPVTERRPRRL
jgi:hypothetical protein